MNLDKLSTYKCIVLHTLLEKGAIAPAAHALGITSNKIHNEIKSIEKAVGHPVLVRNQRRIMLTNVGKKVAEFARIVAYSAKALDNSARTDGVQELHIATTNGIAKGFLPKIIIAFKERYPQTVIHLYSGIEFLDFDHVFIDIVIGLHLNNRADLSQNYLFSATYSMYAAHNYVKSHGIPQKYSDFSKHHILEFKRFVSYPTEIYSYTKPTVSSTHYETLDTLALQGAGIHMFCNELLSPQDRAQLQPVLPDVICQKLKMFFISRRFSEKSDMIDYFHQCCEMNHDFVTKES